MTTRFDFGRMAHLRTQQNMLGAALRKLGDRVLYDRRSAVDGDFFIIDGQKGYDNLRVIYAAFPTLARVDMGPLDGSAHNGR